MQQIPAACAPLVTADLLAVCNGPMPAKNVLPLVSTPRAGSVAAADEAALHVQKGMEGVKALDDFFRITWTAQREEVPLNGAAMAGNPHAPVLQTPMPLSQYQMQLYQQTLWAQLMASQQQQQQHGRSQSHAQTQPAARSTAQEYAHLQPMHNPVNPIASDRKSVV